MSSEPPPVGSGTLALADRRRRSGRRQDAAAASPELSSRGRAPAPSVPSAGPSRASGRPRVHCGSPTFLMFSYMASAIGRLKCPGQALPSRRDVKVVSVISVAAFAMLSPMRHMSMMWS